MNRPGNAIFADPTFPRQQNRRPRGGNTHHRGKYFLHGLAATNDVVQLKALAQLFPQLTIFRTQVAQFQRFVDHRNQMIQRKWLQQKIVSTNLHGLHSVFHGAERGHQYDRNMRILLAHLA